MLQDGGDSDCVVEINAASPQIEIVPLIGAENEEAHVAATIVNVGRMCDEIGDELFPDVADSISFGTGADGVARWLMSEAGPDCRDREDGFHGGRCSLCDNVDDSRIARSDGRCRCRKLFRLLASKIISMQVQVEGSMFDRSVACVFIVGKATRYLITIRN